MSVGKKIGLILAGLTLAASVQAQDRDEPNRSNIAPLPKVASPRVYVLNCGQLVYNRPEFYGLTREEVADTNMPVTCYLVIHPKGILLYDTGLPDRIVGRPLYENVVEGYGELKTKTLINELADIGVLPTDVTHLALSHMHFDHVGNANLFKRSIWLTSRAERRSMFSGPRPDHYYDYADLQSARTVEFDGDHDVFGDGSVVLKSTPGHTPGHQSLFLRLTQTGNVLLSGDLYHYTEELTRKRMPAHEREAGTPKSREAMRALANKTKAQLWIGHSTDFYRAARKSPAWYE